MRFKLVLVNQGVLNLELDILAGILESTNFSSLDLKLCQFASTDLEEHVAKNSSL